MSRHRRICCVTHLWHFMQAICQQSNVWHDSFICVTWLIHTCDLTHSIYVTWHIHTYEWVGTDKFVVSHTCGTLCRPYVNIQRCDMTHSYVWHDSFICMIWLIHMCDTTHSYAWHDSFICVTWPIHTCEMTQSYIWNFMRENQLWGGYDE